MKITLFIGFVLFFIGTFFQVSTGDFASAKAVQIITPVNHSFHLELDNLKPILEADDIKDRHVAIVSIAGAFRKGKSFLSNFFIRYLYAQYKTRDVSDWLGENENSSELSGFKWRNGQKPETIGIWMWSDIFTYDFENGEKVAIILLDTQGIFDSKSSLQDCTTIFAMSMLLSSMQCYNVMQNVQENDLQHLELFTEYGRMVVDKTKEKPFQYLLFIIRDWPFADENNYGWGEAVIDTILAKNVEQTPEMHQLRQRIKSSFDEIGAFLMPYPGQTVALKKNFNGNLKQIDPDFIKYVKELVPSIFAPENLIVKRINGEKVRARDLIEYMQAYLNVFNGNSLPKAINVVDATAQASNLILFNNAMDLYAKSMQKALRDIDPYFSATELFEIHETAKNESISQFLRKRKLGSDDLITSFVRRIENTTEEMFLDFQQENNEKRKVFIDKANLYNEKLVIELRTDFEKKVLNEIERMESISAESLKQLLENTKESSFVEFHAKMMGDAHGDITSSFSENLQMIMDSFQSSIVKMLTSYKDSVNSYSNLMLNMLNNGQYYAEQRTLAEKHQFSKKQAVEQFQLGSYGVPHEMISIFEHKAENDIEKKYTSLVEKNQKIRNQFIAKANAHNADLVEEIESNQRTSAYAQVNNVNSYLEHTELSNICYSARTAALKEYDLRKMGDSDLSLGYRTQLEMKMHRLESDLESVNKNNKFNYGMKKTAKTGAFTAGGAATGAAIAGPPGALLGGLIGVLISLF